VPSSTIEKWTDRQTTNAAHVQTSEEGAARGARSKTVNGREVAISRVTVLNSFGVIRQHQTTSRGSPQVTSYKPNWVALFSLLPRLQNVQSAATDSGLADGGAKTVVCARAALTVPRPANENHGIASSVAYPVVVRARDRSREEDVCGPQVPSGTRDSGARPLPLLGRFRVAR